MARYRGALPQAKGELTITDGGIETDLIFHHGFDLPLFAAFPLVAEDSGREAPRRYYEEYAGIARANRVGLILECPTWRANPNRATQLGYTLEELAGMNRAGAKKQPRPRPLTRASSDRAPPRAGARRGPTRRPRRSRAPRAPGGPRGRARARAGRARPAAPRARPRGRAGR